MALTTFDGLAEGTDLGIQVENRIERWSYRLTGLSRPEDPVGLTVPLELFSGYLREGLIFLREDTPPQVGDWFAWTPGWQTVVLGVEGESCRVGEFLNGNWNGVTTCLSGTLMTEWRLCDPPRLDPGTVVQILNQLDRYKTETDRLREFERNQQRMRDDLHGIETYLNRAKGRMTNA